MELEHVKTAVLYVSDILNHKCEINFPYLMRENGFHYLNNVEKAELTIYGYCTEKTYNYNDVIAVFDGKINCISDGSVFNGNYKNVDSIKVLLKDKQGCNIKEIEVSGFDIDVNLPERCFDSIVKSESDIFINNLTNILKREEID